MNAKLTPDILKMAKITPRQPSYIQDSSFDHANRDRTPFENKSRPRSIQKQNRTKKRLWVAQMKSLASKVQTLASGLFAGVLHGENITRNTYICIVLSNGSEKRVHWSAERIVLHHRQVERVLPRERAEPMTKKKLVDGNCTEKLFKWRLFTNWRSRAIRFYIEGRCHRWQRINNQWLCCDALWGLYRKAGFGSRLSNSSYPQRFWSRFWIKNEVSTIKLQTPKLISTLSYENTVRVKHFISLRPLHFTVFAKFSSQCFALESINYWTSKDCPATENARTGPQSDYFSFHWRRLEHPIIPWHFVKCIPISCLSGQQ